MSSKSEKVIDPQEIIERKSKAKKYFFYPILLGLIIILVAGLFSTYIMKIWILHYISNVILMTLVHYALISWIYTGFILCKKDTKLVRIILTLLFLIISIIWAIGSLKYSSNVNSWSWLDAVIETNHSNSIQYPEKVWKLVLSSVKEKNVKIGTKRGLPNGKFVSMEEWVNIYYSPENNLEYPFANIHIDKSSSGSFEQDESNLIDLIFWENEESEKKWISNMIEYSTWMIISQYPFQEITMKEGNSGVKSHIVIFDKIRDTSITIYFLNQGDVNNIYKNHTEFLENKKQFLEEFLSFYKK